MGKRNIKLDDNFENTHGNKINIDTDVKTIRKKENVKYLPQIKSSFYVGAKSILSKYTGGEDDKTNFVKLNGRGKCRIILSLYLINLQVIYHNYL